VKKILVYVGGAILLMGILAFSGQIGRFVGRLTVENYRHGKQESFVEGAMEAAAK
jgi:hypothetical protein